MREEELLSCLIHPTHSRSTSQHGIYHPLELPLQLAVVFSKHMLNFQIHEASGDKSFRREQFHKVIGWFLVFILIMKASSPSLPFSEFLFSSA